MKLIHPKCKGNTCGSWEICSEEAEEMEIKIELQEEDKYEN